jgi:hypothetical protein
MSLLKDALANAAALGKDIKLTANQTVQENEPKQTAQTLEVVTVVAAINEVGKLAQ